MLYKKADLFNVIEVKTFHMLQMRFNSVYSKNKVHNIHDNPSFVMFTLVLGWFVLKVPLVVFERY